MPPVSKRFTITVPDSVYEDLEHWSDQQGRPAANLAAFLVEVGILAAKERGKFNPKTLMPLARASKESDRHDSNIIQTRVEF